MLFGYGILLIRNKSWCKLGVFFVVCFFYGVFGWLVGLGWLFNTVIFSNVALERAKFFRKSETELLMDSPGLFPCPEWLHSKKSCCPILCPPSLGSAARKGVKENSLCFWLVLIQFCTSQRWIWSGDKLNHFCWNNLFAKSGVLTWWQNQNWAELQGSVLI